MTTEIRVRYNEYEAYLKAQHDADLPPVDYEVWMSVTLANEKNAQVRRPIQQSVKKELREKQMQADLMALQANYFDYIGDIIWKRDKRFSTWEERRDTLILYLTRLSELITERVKLADLNND